jgi:geranylgeranyl diphosphate synthase type II
MTLTTDNCPEQFLAREAQMDATARIERSLVAALSNAESRAGPPRLAAAVRHAVFPKGSRIRPRLCLAVAEACGARDSIVVDCAAAAIELLHCASLVHDDLPCFDDSPTRRGRPTVHAAFGEPLAVLAGDTLIVLAFETIARKAARAPDILPGLLLLMARAAGTPFGIAAGQAWECEPRIDLAHYHRAKTGALFVAAAAAGAVAAGREAGAWHGFGECLGQAYQVADDIRDAAGSAEDMGKPIHQDAALGRPNAVQKLGITGAVGWLEELVTDAVRAIPACPGANDLRSLIASEAQRLLPKEFSRHAA